MSVCFVVFGQVWAQSQTVNGTVLYATSDEPVIGASVLVQGSSEGTITDVNGKFSLRVKKGAILSVSFIGMITEQVAAADGMVVRLREDTEEIDEVMVVAFGTTTRKSFTGSASVVKSEEISKRQTSNITNSLAGQVAGVQGLSSNGQPGEVSSIRIRGLGSMSASNKPLYVVDGIAADDEVVATLSNSDIASVTVLKDAASNALYGARGANGVVLITTKRGSTKDAQVSIDAKWGVNQRGVPTYDVMTDPGQYYSTFYTALYNQLGDATKAYNNLFNASQGGLGYQVYTIPEGERLVGPDGSINPGAKLGYVYNYNGATYTLQPDNWYKELFRSNNLRQEYNVSVSGSSDKLTYYSSASFLDDTGLIENSDYKRVTARINVDYQAKKWLKIGTNMSYSHADQRYPDMENGNPSSVNLFYVSNFMAPIYPLYIRDGQGNIMTDANGYKMYDFGDGKVNGVIRPFMSQSNPASNIELNKELFKRDIMTGKWYVQVEPIKGLKATANVGVHYAGIRYQTVQNPFYGQFAESGGFAYVSTSRYMAIDQQYLLTYTKKFQAHNIDILAGYENFRYLMATQSGQKSMVYDPTIAEISNAVLSPSASSASDSYFTQGILAQVKYDYDSRYFVSASYRRDASSRFAPGHQWGNFWSVGAAWDINAESFMSDIENIDLLKLKVSYGSQGNDNLGNYHVWTDQFSLTEQNGLPAVTLIYKGNEDLTWETSYNFNAGIDFGFFGDRLTGTVEGWRRRTTDMLYFRPVSPSLGYSSIPVNVGSVSNAGLDVELHGDAIKTKNFTWSIFANMSYYKNKILKLAPELNGQLIDGSWMYREGESMYNFYVRDYAGVNPETGKAQWYIDKTDAEGNVTRDVTENWSEATRYETGDILPKVYGGFGTSFNFFGVDISAACSYQLGGKIYDSGYAELMHTGSSADAGKNWHVDILNAWTPENKTSNIPLVNAAEEYENATSTRFLTSSNYLSLQNITVGYTLPKKVTEKIKMEKLRVYFVADNVALLSARRGLDPRQSFSTSSQDSYSPIRSLSAGINITF